MKYIFIFFLALTSAANADVSSPGEKLKIADQIRSTNVNELGRILDSILIDDLNDSDFALYEYLDAYRDLVTGNFASGEQKLHSIRSSSPFGEFKVRAAHTLVNLYAVNRDWLAGLDIINWLNIQDIGDISNSTQENTQLSVLIFLGAIGDFRNALQKSKELISREQSDRNQCIAYQESLRSMLGLNMLNEFPEYYDLAIKACQKANEIIFTNEAHVLGAQYYIKNDKFSKAQDILQRNLRFAQESNYSQGIIRFNSTLAQIYYSKGNNIKAQTLANRVYQDRANLKGTEALVGVLEVLYQMAEESGDYEKSLVFYKEYSEENKKLFDEAKAKQMAIQESRYKASEQEKEIYLLQTQAALAKEEIENNQLILALVCSIALLLFVWGYRSRRHHLRFKKLAETDSLTGINNRNHYTELAEHQLALAKARSQSCSMILFDLDHFKRVNDDYGHQIGDWTLQAAVNAAMSICRSNDVIGRLGGEEFAILMPNCDVEKAHKIAEHCRKAIAAVDTSPCGHKFSVTASFGVTDTARCGYEFNKLYACADAAMYCSKDQGRNRIYLFSDEMLPAIQQS